MKKNTQTFRFRSAALVAILAASSLLSGCGALIVGGAATTAAVAADRRTTGEQVEDKSIEIKIAVEMNRMFGENAGKARVSSVSYDGKVLLVGDVPTQEDKAKVESTVTRIENVKEVINRLRVGDITPLSVRTNDTWLTTKVKASLIDAKEVPARTIVVTTERGIVYLMGKVTETEGRMAAKVASGVTGVNEVVKLFTIVARESLVGESVAPSSTTATPATGSGTAAPAPSGDVQAMPVK
jgi:osmotically-inducible protein OsmY